jgi:molybdopterin converting factor subunit 1
LFRGVSNRGALVSVQALFFAAYRELLGTSVLSVSLPEGATVGDLVRELRGRGAPYDALPRDPAIAVNRAYALYSEPLRAGDEVAFIPPVAGG